MTQATALQDRALELLRARFGYPDFRPGQQAIIEALGHGQNVLAVMPTGSGKSLCYQLPAVLNAGCTLVISPLIALMKDQVDALQAQGIAATFINSSLAAHEQQERLRACQAGAYDLLYIAPERLRSARFLHVLAQMRISLFAVDEAHCISEWGHDFRPDYLRLSQAIEALQHPQVLALTATATVEVQNDIVQQLGCEDMQRFVTGFDRVNLVYRVLGTPGQAGKLAALKDILDAQTGGSAIIYAATRRTVEEIAAALHQRGTEVLVYHAGLPDTVRHRTQEAFMAQQHGVIVATNAFGMGVDKSDVRCVIHFNLPRSMEAYYQEAGRAGRDGLPAQCILLFSYGDVKIQEFLLEQSYPERALVEEAYGLIVALSRRQPEVPLRSLLLSMRRGTSEMLLSAGVKLLEKAGYVERLSSYDGADDLSSGAPHTLVRLAAEPVVPAQLVFDDAALQRRKQHELQKVRRMVSYATARQCRRQKILGYFGERWPQENCATCDHCLSDGAYGGTAVRPVRAPSEAEWLVIQKILSCVARMRGYYGRAKVVQVLLGSQAKDIRDTHLVRLSTHGILKGAARPYLEAYLDALLDAGCLQVVGEEFPKLDLTPLGQAVMRRQRLIQLALPGTAAPASRTALRMATVVSVPSLEPEVVAPVVLASVPTAGSAPPVAEPPDVAVTSVVSYDAALFEHLREHRTSLARAEALPPYCIVNDRTLRDMAARLPTDHPGLLQIHGIGETKAGKYGESFLAVIRAYLAKRETAC